MLKTFVIHKGNTYINALRRSVMSGVIVPSQSNFLAKMPAGAASPTQSRVLVIEGPSDARTEMYQLVGRTGLHVVGPGTITMTMASQNIVGVGTAFQQNLLVGDKFVLNGETLTIQTITDDTHATTSAGAAAGHTAEAYAYYTTANANVDALMTAVITDQGWQRDLMNRDVPCTHLFGSNRKPSFLRETSLLELNQTLAFRFYNNASAVAPGSFGLSMEGRKWQQEATRRESVAKYIESMRARKMFCQPYWLTLDDGIVTLPADGTAIRTNLTCTGDVWLTLFNLYITCYSESELGDTNNFAQVELFDGRTGRQLQSAPWTVGLGGGTAQNPFVLPSPLIIEPQTQIMCRVSNLQLVRDVSVKFMLTLGGAATLYGRGAINDREVRDEAARIYNAPRNIIRGNSV